jgi:hypothetical protein
MPPAARAATSEPPRGHAVTTPDPTPTPPQAPPPADVPVPPPATVVAPPAPGMEPGPPPQHGCGFLIDGTRYCGASPVARLTAQYTAGDQTLLCAQHRAGIPDTVEWDGETITTTEPVPA